jgi:hypothetical protein
MAYSPASAHGPAKNVPLPVLPAAAKEFSMAGLEAFSRYWYSTLSYVEETGDGAPLEAVTNSWCKHCWAVAESLESHYVKGGWVVGGMVKVSSSKGIPETRGFDIYEARVLVQQQQITEYRSDGSLQGTKAAGKPFVDVFIARWENHQWTTQNIWPASSNE